MLVVKGPHLIVPKGALSRGEEGQIDLRLEATDLAGLAVEVAERLRTQFEGKQVELSVGPEPRCRSWQTDTGSPR